MHKFWKCSFNVLHDICWDKTALRNWAYYRMACVHSWFSACLYVCLVRTLLSHHFLLSNDKNFQLYSKPWRRRVTSFLFSLAHDKVVLLCANLVLKTDSNTRPNYVAAVTIQSSRYSRICLKLNVKHTCRKTQTLSLDSSLKNTALL